MSLRHERDLANLASLMICNHWKNGSAQLIRSFTDVELTPKEGYSWHSQPQTMTPEIDEPIGERFMPTIRLRSHVGDDAKLQVQLPEQLANQEVEIVLSYQRWG